MNQFLSQERLRELMRPFTSCTLCPRNCRADRLNGETGICGSDSSINIASVFLHRGEEPAISGANGIVNVFFNRCNLQCIYCQNHQISRNKGKIVSRYVDFQQVVHSIISLLETGCNSVGFVSPTHFIPHVKVIIEILRLNGFSPVFVYNTNGYDEVEQLRSLESYIDVYLPDYKYSDNQLAKKFSKVENYQEVALAAIKEMYRQKGTTLVMSPDGWLERGLVVRHLVLPNQVDNSIRALEQLADISVSLAVSLMSQYFPSARVADHAILGRKTTQSEYQQVLDALHSLGFYKGWVQDLESSDTYQPDFEQDIPFI